MKESRIPGEGDYQRPTVLKQDAELVFRHLDVYCPHAVDVKVTEDELSVLLEDGRTLVVPLAWYPRLFHSSQRQRARWRLIGRGVGIHWPAIDEDIGVEGLLAGRRSGESQKI